MTSADVKFSIDDARAQSKGWGYLDAAIKNITTPTPSTVVFHLKFKWAPFLADIALFANGIIPNNFAGQTRTAFYKHPIGTGPFMWDKRVVGQSVTFKRNPFYWQKGKPYLDSVTWTFVTDENTRELQLRGGQIQVDEFPPFNSITKLQHTSGVTMTLFPSTRTDYLEMNEQYAPLADVHVRRAISYAIDRQAIVKSVLFGYGTPANSFLPPQVPFYEQERAAVCSSTWRRRRPRWRSRSTRRASRCTLLVGAGAQVESAMGQILQNQLKQLGINVTFKQEDTSTEFHDIQTQKYQLGFSYWTMDIADPDELVTFAHRSEARRRALLLHRLQQPDGDQASRTRRSGRRTSRSGRSSTRSSSRSRRTTRSSGFLYYSPFR